MPDWSAIATELEKNDTCLRRDAAARPVGGGDISAAWRLPTDSGDLFIKTGRASAADMFAAEAAGLNEIARCGAVRVPRVIAAGRAGETAFLALEWLQLGASTAATDQAFGRQLASMHRQSADRYGWHRDNWIGLTPQANPWSEDWVGFFREQRLGAQLRLAQERGFRGELQQAGARLMKRLPVYFGSREVLPSLLHGDLWGGNRGTVDGQPVIFDPAVYYGDRETDIAMTRLFGGFSEDFYKGYDAEWPLPDGYLTRQPLYQLYHVLNHLNLFGSGYLAQALRLIEQLLQEHK